MRNLDGLAWGNERRTKEAARRVVAKAERAYLAIESAGPSPRQSVNAARLRYLQALELRLEFPGDTLAQLAARFGTTKDAYWRVLSRALDHGERLAS